MYKFIIIILSISIFTSCFTERIELDYNQDDNKKVVVAAWITTLDEPQYVEISNTVNYLGAFTPDGLSGAVVTLSDHDDTYDLVEKEKGKYYLPGDWVAKVGDVYQLKILLEGKEYTATHQMRPCPEIDDFRIQVSGNLEDADSLHIYETSFGFQELPGEGDAYYGIDYLKNSLDKDSLNNGSFTNDDFVDGIYFEDVILSESDRLFAIGDTVVLDIYSIGIETSNFLTDIQNEIFRGSPFDAPPANVRTNITGGAIGYFVIGDARRVEAVVE